MSVSTVLKTFASLQNDPSATTDLNTNFSAINTALTNSLAINGQAPNQMQAPLDMNSNQILNLPPPGTVNSPVRLVDVVLPIPVPSSILSGNNVFTGTNTVPTASVGTKTGQIASTLFVEQNQVAINPVFFGADPTGVADSTSAFNLALAAGNCIQFPAGTFKFLSPITVTLPNSIASLTIRGAGQDATILSWPSGNGLTVNCANANNSIHISDLTFATGSASGTNTGLTLTTTGAFVTVTESDLFRLTFRDTNGYLTGNFWGTAINVIGIQNLNVTSVYIDGPSAVPGSANGNGLAFAGIPASSIYSTVLNVIGCSFNYLTVGFTYGSFVQGVTIAGSNFTGCTIGINVPAAETGALDQLTVIGNQFGQFAAGNSISISTAVAALMIQGNGFGTSAGAFISSSILIAQSSNTTITGNTLIGSVGANSSGIVIGTQASVTCSTISGNIIGGYHTGITLNAGSNAQSITGNQFIGNINTILNFGTGTHWISNNLGYNPVGPISLTPTASPWTYVNGASPATIYLTGGTVSNVTVGGIQVATSTPTHTELGPNDSIIVTYSSVPTAQAYVH